MKVCKHVISGIIILNIILNLSILIPNISAPPPSPPIQFIAEFFPNSTLPLQLTYTSTAITFNATDFPHQIDIDFDANYTIYNPENTANISIILPFSMEKNINDFMYEVNANNTQIQYDIFSISPWNENITVIDIDFAHFIEIYPIALIRTNVSLLINSTSVIRYHFSGSITNPLDSSNLFSLSYHIGTSQAWIGNTTGKVEIRAIGKQPVFGLMGSPPPYQVVNRNGIESIICEWNNTKSPSGDIEIKFYKEPSLFEKLGELIRFMLIGPLAIVTLIIVFILIRRKRKRIELI